MDRAAAGVTEDYMGVLFPDEQEPIYSLNGEVVGAMPLRDIVFSDFDDTDASTCYLCGDKVDWTKPVVYWVAAELLAFHADCARDFGTHLIGDARTAMMGGAGEKLWKKFTVRTMRHVLNEQERQS